MDERMRILKMIEDGTITAGEAAKLLDALGADPQTASVSAASGRGADAFLSDPAPSDAARDYDSQMLYILVDDKAGGDKVNVRFPIGAIKKMLKITGRLPIPEEKLNGFDLKSMMDVVSDCLDNELRGDLVDISGGNGTTVRIFVK